MALDGVGQAGHQEEKGFDAQVGDACGHDFLRSVGGQQPDGRCLDQLGDEEDDGEVDSRQHQPPVKALIHPLLLLRAPVLGGAGHDAVADGLGGNPGEVLDFAACVEGVDGDDALGVDDTLDADLSDGLSGLLEGGEGADFQRLLQKCPVHLPIAAPQLQLGCFIHDVP